MEQFIAHVRETDEAIQTIREHDEGVAEMSSRFSLLPYRDIVYDSGILHDIGKYQFSFQEKIRGKNLRVDHSTAGAIEAKKLLPFPANLIAEYIIAGHHAGIPDGGEKSDQPGEGKGGSSLSARLKKENELEDYSGYQKDGLCNHLRPVSKGALVNELARDCGKETGKLIDKFAFLVRFCYSCLVDADSLDTEKFCRNTDGREPLGSDFRACLVSLDRKLQEFVCTTTLQKTRAALQGQAFANIQTPGEIYMMNMPTGSGKTFCGAKCALMKAISEHKKRIIYVIPYNSIITQTADELSSVFGNDAQILRHQSTYSVEDDENASDEYKVHVEQATENWDADLIITTMVQFFETVFSNRRSKLRKMHNMADSVLIFDEAHLMPLQFLQPCLQTIVYLTRYANCSAIFLTATMPDYEHILQKYTFPDVHVIDLVPDKSDFRYFKKCSYQEIGILPEEEFVHLCQKDPSILIVVNSRKTARRLFQLLNTHENRKVFQLSTFMTKADIQSNIEQIREILVNQNDGAGKQKEQVIVVSTSLIEAGVDLDFYTVFREYTGLDSILQAGGRCNREGKRPQGNVFVFEIENEKGKQDDIRTMVTRSLLKEYNDISDSDCIREYFDRVYLADREEITRNSMHQFCSNISNIPFASYDGSIIKSTEQSIVVPQSEEAEKMIAQLQFAGVSRSLVRRMQKYTCSVPLYMFEELVKTGVLNDFGTGIFVLTNMDYYDPETGIRSEGRDYFI